MIKTDGELIYEKTKGLGLSAIGGLGVESIPLIVSAVIAYHEHGCVMEGFWVRNEIKDHGTEKLFEGYVPSDGKVAFICLDRVK